MFYSIPRFGGIYKAGQDIDVTCYDGTVTTLRVRCSAPATGFPANALQIIDNGALPPAQQNAAGSNTVQISVTVDSTDIRDNFVIRTSNAPELYNHTLFIEGLNSNNEVVKVDTYHIHAPTSLYKKVSLVPNYETARAQYLARRTQDRNARSKSYIWFIRMIVDAPPAPEEVYELTPTQVFGIDAVFEEIAYGQGVDMISTGSIRIAKAELSPSFNHLIGAIAMRGFDKPTSRGVAMVEFYNDDFSWVLNNVPVAPQFKINANGMGNNAENNSSEINVYLSGKNMIEVISGLTYINPV